MRIRLSYDGLTQKQFFQNILIAYVEGDESILAFVENLKERLLIHSAKNRLKTKKMTEASRLTKRNFSLSESEKEEIFDLISKEIGDI